MKALEFLPAPKRGQYDRGLTRRERQAAQQERVIAAIAEVSASGRELSVANVVAHAGIGRNTFYEYFDDVDHALIAIKNRARRELAARVETALQIARTPLERVRALARAWVENLFANPSLAKLALRAQPAGLDSTELSALGRYIATVLEAELDARSALPGLADRLRTTVVAALFDAVSRAHLGESPLPLEDLQRVLAELSLRLLR